MSSAGQTLLDWVGPMNLATAVVLLAAVLTDRALERRTCAAARLLPYLAVLVRLALPAGWSSPLGLLGSRRPAPPASAELDLTGVTFVSLDAPPATVELGVVILALWAVVSLTLLGCWIRARVLLRRQLRAAVVAGTSESGIPVLSHPVLGPLVVGLWRSRIVVPEALVKNSDPEPLRWVLRHESAHVCRHDPLLSSVVQVVCLLAWPILPVWIAARRIRTLMEIACDERAVAREDGAARRRYGEVLLALADGAPARSSLAGVLSFASPLRGRLRALVPRRRWPALVQALVVQLVAVLAVACAGAPSGEDGAVDIDGASAEVQEEAAASVAGNAPTGAAMSSAPGGQAFLGRFGKREATGGYGGRGLLPELRAPVARSSSAPAPLAVDAHTAVAASGTTAPLAGRPRPSRVGLVPVVNIWGDGSAWVSTPRGGHRRLHYRAGQGGTGISPALVPELRAALDETGARTVLVRSDRTLSMDQVTPLLAAARRAGGDDHAISVQLRQQRMPGRFRAPPPLMTVSARGKLMLEDRVVTLANLEEHLRHELAWREQDTVLLRGDRIQRDFPEVNAIAKRAGARAVGALDESQSYGAGIHWVKGSRREPPVLTVTKEGLLFLDGLAVTARGLEESLRFELTSRGQDTLLIRGDKRTVTNSAVDVMAIAKRAGARQIGIMAIDAPAGAAPAPRSPTGMLDPALLAKEVRTHMPDVRRCYEAALRAKPGLSGRIVLKFTVAADGQVETASMGESTLASPQTESCVVDLARTWRFPAPQGGPVEAEFPFVFASKGD